jgi:hypothetical protein
MLPPYSGQKIKPRKKPALYVPQKFRFATNGLHGVTAQKIILFLLALSFAKQRQREMVKLSKILTTLCNI